MINIRRLPFSSFVAGAVPRLSTSMTLLCSAATIAASMIPASTDAAAPCPSGRFSTTGKWRGCACPENSKKDYSGVFKSHAECRGQHVECPTGRFATTGAYHACSCPAGSSKEYTDVLKAQAKCKGNVVPCPAGRFSTTSTYNGCECPEGTSKEYTDPLLKSIAECNGHRTACPTGQFATTGKYHDCTCPDGSHKDYSGVGNSQAHCEGFVAACPGGEFSTTGTYRGCRCGEGQYKWYLDVVAWKAKCRPGKTPEVACREAAGKWLGINASKGVCVPQGLGRYQLYEAYFGHVSTGATEQGLPEWMKKALGGSLKNVNLGNVRVAETSHTSGRNAMTDCNKMYFPRGSGVIAALNAGAAQMRNANALSWFLHELAHVEQCAQSSRKQYAEMWFNNLDDGLIGAIVDGDVDAKAIHDRMPMEKAADRRMNELLNLKF